MKIGFKMPTSLVLLAAPLAAFADPIPETGHVQMHALIGGAVGGAIGGLLGALIACWLCNRRRRDDSDPKKY